MIARESNCGNKRPREEGQQQSLPSCISGETPVFQANKRQASGVEGHKFASKVEADPKKLEMRMKQIQFGKNTIGYDNYLAAIPKHKRGSRGEHPRTPDPFEVQSKRSFDGRIKAWRRSLHLWDSKEEPSVSAKLFASEPADSLDNLLKEDTEAKIKASSTTSTMIASSDRNRNSDRTSDSGRCGGKEGLTERKGVVYKDRRNDENRSGNDGFNHRNSDDVVASMVETREEGNDDSGEPEGGTSSSSADHRIVRLSEEGPGGRENVLVSLSVQPRSSTVIVPGDPLSSSLSASGGLSSTMDVDRSPSGTPLKASMGTTPISTSNRRPVRRIRAHNAADDVRPPLGNVLLRENLNYSTGTSNSDEHWDDEQEDDLLNNIPPVPAAGMSLNYTTTIPTQLHAATTGDEESHKNSNNEDDDGICDFDEDDDIL